MAQIFFEDFFGHLPYTNLCFGTKIISQGIILTLKAKVLGLFGPDRIETLVSMATEIVLARLRIGHTRLTHSCLLKREERPYCIGCDTSFTVRHFLLDCADFNRERRSLIQVNNLKDLFKDVSVENILSFLKNINLFNKI